MQLDFNKIHLMDCLAGLKLLPDKSVNCCITSPPYWNLRDYQVKGQLGLENTPTAFIKKLVLIFREVKRVLTDDGTIWVNIGDSYAATGKNRTEKQATKGSNINGSLESQKQSLKQKSKIVGDLKPKDLVGIPWMLAFALRKDGWYLRQDIIWSKPNPMPESVTDRCTKSHEYIFMLSKSRFYYYDYNAIKTEAKNPQDDLSRLQSVDENHKSIATEQVNGLRKKTDKQSGHYRRHDGFNDRWDQMSKEDQMSLKANKRSVWTVSTKPYSDAHFATYPPDLIVDCIKAGCTVGGVVLDPFMGAGTTALVSAKLGRQFIGFELNPNYIKIANKRLAKELGFFNPEPLKK